ncbi:SMI1/KNR4 family protein [Paenibacillus macquariensis]|nr:SMI1/KNR4 family protein [Paenibacillus macquariensis]MEC0090875.1 SMI1/KNR4 family protein [Paenibacillus macquariensis]
MIKEQFIEQMINLASCRTSPEEWSSWWNNHNEQLESFLNRGEYLRLKPIMHGFRWVPIVHSQKGAIKYLDDNNILYVKENSYQENYENELNESIKANREMKKQRLIKIKAEYPEIFNRYPKFSNSLQYNFDESDFIQVGLNNDKFEEFKITSGIKMPEDITNFFKTASAISLEGIRIEFEHIYPLELLGKTYYVLGEFWKEADGDLVLWDPSESNDLTKIYYYAHEQNKIKLLSKSFEDLIEKVFANYNKNL